MSERKATVSKVPAMPRSSLLKGRMMMSDGSISSTSSGQVVNAIGVTHEHANMSTLNRLIFDSGFLCDLQGDGPQAIKVAHSTTSDSATYATTAGDSEKWSGANRADYVDQPVRKTDSPTFGTIKAMGIQSPSFVDGIANVGGGYRLRIDNTTGRSELFIDQLTVRESMSVMRLTIQEVKAVGGVLVVSPGGGQVKAVRIWANMGQVELVLNDRAAAQFAVGDFVRCSRVTAAGSVLSHYWVDVKSVDLNTGSIFVTMDQSQSMPCAGDEIVVMGNIDRRSGRDGCIIISVEGGKPRVAAYDHINTPSLDAARLCCIIGKLDGLTFNGAIVNGYGLMSENAFLSGIFKLNNGQTIETWLNVESGKITTGIKDGLKSTGIDIESGVIRATADNFVIANSEGRVTAAVTADGQLITNCVVCVDPDTGNVLRTTNEYGNGWDIYYDNMGARLTEIGWDGTSFMRFYQNGRLVAKVDATGQRTENTSTRITLYLTSYDEAQKSKYQTIPGQSLAGQSYNADSIMPGKIDLKGITPPDGMYIEAGVTKYDLYNADKTEATSQRQLYKITSGKYDTAGVLKWTTKINNSNNL